MLEKVKKYFTSISKVCVLEQISFEGKIEYNYLELSLLNDDFKILKQNTFLNLESFKELNKNKLPVVLNVNGFNVLTKINPSSIETFENDNFQFSHSILDGDNYYNIVRKEIITEVENYIKFNNFLLLDIFVGAFNIIKYQDLINNQNNSQPHVFNIENDLLKYSFEKKDNFIYNKINIGETLLPTNFVSPLTTGLDYLISTQFDKNKSEYNINRNESLFSKFSKLALVFFIGVLLVSLLTNLFYQNHLSNKYQDSEYQSSLLEDKENQIKGLEKSIYEKQRVFNDYGLSSDIQFAEYLDVIALLKPSYLTLTSLTINPLKKEMKEGKKIELLSNKIFVSGTVNEIETLNKYLIKIESYQLFKKAKIVIFSQESTSSKFKLEIEI